MQPQGVGDSAETSRLAPFVPPAPGVSQRLEYLPELGRHLQMQGLSERAVRHCLGISCVLHVSEHNRMTGVPTYAPSVPPPAALLVHLFVAGRTVSATAWQRRLGADSARLVAELGLVAVQGDAVTATVAIVPVGAALVVSDRVDRLRGRDLAAFADDSALHTIGAVPPGPRAGRWLDVGTGSGIVPLARPGAAQMVLGTDINPRAVAMAELSAALSRRADISVRVANLFADAARREGPWDRITFNAPIPRHVVAAAADAPSYRHGDSDILDRFWNQVRALVAPGGEVIVHSWQPTAGYPACLDLPGEVVAARYTPAREQLAFGVTVWRPDGVAGCRLVQVALDVHNPHVHRTMFA